MEPINLRGIYTDPGPHEIRFMIPTDISIQEIKKINFNLLRCDGVIHELPTSRWGRKVVVTLDLNATPRDGLYVIEYHMMIGDSKINKRFDFWVVK